MTMKKILMAAVAVSVLTASAASAASISTAAGGTTFAGVNLVPTAGTVPEAYTIANEVNLTTTTAGTLALTVEPLRPSAWVTIWSRLISLAVPLTPLV